MDGEEVKPLEESAVSGWGGGEAAEANRQSVDGEEVKLLEEFAISGWGGGEAARGICNQWMGRR